MMDPYQPDPIESLYRRRQKGPDDRGTFIAKVVAGFLALFVLGFIASTTWRGQPLFPFIGIAFVSALFMKRRDSLRGFALGVLLGLGLILLLATICGGMILFP